MNWSIKVDKGGDALICCNTVGGAMAANGELDRCDKLVELMKAQKDVILRHVDEHKWFHHIPDTEKGAADFIKKYGWLMREIFCVYACPNKDTCKIAKELAKRKK